jgi:hypothetical protein
MKMIDEKINQCVQDIIGYMTKHKELTTKESTCDYRGWDRDKHRLFPQVASKLRTMGYSVTSSINHGVTDWVITLISKN